MAPAPTFALGAGATVFWSDDDIHQSSWHDDHSGWLAVQVALDHVTFQRLPLCLLIGDPRAYPQDGEGQITLLQIDSVSSHAVPPPSML